MLAIIILAFSILFGELTAMVFSRMKPGYQKNMIESQL